jgi:hypothetical protein
MIQSENMKTSYRILLALILSVMATGLTYVLSYLFVEAMPKYQAGANSALSYSITQDGSDIVRQVTTLAFIVLFPLIFIITMRVGYKPKR